MFKITPVQSKKEQAALCEQCHSEYREEAFCYVMFDIESGEVMGISQFEIGEVGYIFDLRETPGRSDFEAMFILGRQTMNFIELCGARTVKASDAYTDSSLLRAIGFKKLENGEYFCNMEGMFDGKHCSGHAVDLEEAAKN